MMHEYRRKLIEVALPLDAINKASAREKSIRHGHPSTLHLWWARRPLAACRAVLFAQMVDDPSSLPDEFPTEEAQEAERQRLFRIIEEMVKWENTTNETVLHAARTEIARSAARNHGVSLPHSMTPAEVANALKRYAPPVLDPFAGGGSIPLEAQRLGLEAHASDLNPVAVLINKALIEIPPKFGGRPPVNPESRKKYLAREWRGAQGLAEDVQYYGQWMRDEAFRRIGHLYPKVRLPKEQGGGEATVIAWLWARTVKCPNPGCGAQMPLLKSFQISARRGISTYLVPLIDRSCQPPSIHFDIQSAASGPSGGTVQRQAATCIACQTTVSLDYVRDEGRAGRLGAQLIGIVAAAKGKRLYLPGNAEQGLIARSAVPTWEPQEELSLNARHMAPPLYGMTAIADLFTRRQLVALTTFSSLVQEAANKVRLESSGDDAYSIAAATYLAFALDKAANYWSSFCSWYQAKEIMVSTFGLPSLGIVWDYAEANPFSESSGNWMLGIEQAAKSLDTIPSRNGAQVRQADAQNLKAEPSSAVISTDPPYYSNVPYADLSDVFYAWLRHSLGSVYPSLFSTVLAPKTQELVADPVRQGNKQRAQRFFEEGLRQAFSQARDIQIANYPLTVFYAFKQSETEQDSDGSSVNASKISTGWETMLDGLLKSGLAITGTWPMRTEQGGGLREAGRNALASSIVLVCRPQPMDATLTTRRDFLQALHRELPHALRDLQRGLIAPVDLAQAAIGPGMAVFSRYSKVLESDGTPMRVRTALQLINQTLDEVLAEQEGEYDADTRWAVAWFEQYGMEEGPYGIAETLSKAKNTSVEAMRNAGIVKGPVGKVRLVRRDELPEPWNPATARRLTAWEVTQRLIRALETEGEQGAAAILDHVGALGEIARDLAYRLYIVCERKKWADQALAYNSLVVEWTGISGAADQIQRTTATQASMF